MARRTDGGARIGTETPNQGVRKRRGSVSALPGEDSARSGRQPVPPSPDKDPSCLDAICVKYKKNGDDGRLLTTPTALT